jgi:hypothetical protein
VNNYTTSKADLDSGLVCNYTTPSNFTLQSHTLDWAPSNSSLQEIFLTRINTTAQTTYNYSTEIISFATLLLDWNKSLDIHECSLSWCAKVFRNATAQGSLFSVHVDEYPLQLGGYWFEPVGEAEYLTYEAQADFPTSFNSTFTIQSTNAYALSSFLISVLDTGSFIEYHFQSGRDMIGMADPFSMGPAMMNNPSIPYMSDRIAISLTNVIRNFTSDYIIHNLGDSVVQIQYISVGWEWLAFPASVVLLGILLLLTTMIQSHRENALVWKCSSLALLFHPLQGWDDGEMARTSKKEMDKCAKGMRGQLSQSDDAGLRIIKA